MKTPLCLLIMAASLNAAEPAFTERDWKPGTSGLTIATHVRYDEAAGAFEVKGDSKAEIPVITDAQPGVGVHSYSLRGEVRYEQVGDKGYLETWTRVGIAKLPAQTQGDQGLMAKLSGSSSWRGFVLSTHLAGTTDPVKQIELDVVLPDGGTVWLRNLRLEPLKAESKSPYLSLALAASATVLAAVFWFAWRRGKKQRGGRQAVKSMRP